MSVGIFSQQRAGSDCLCLVGADDVHNILVFIYIQPSHAQTGILISKTLMNTDATETAFVETFTREQKHVN